MSSVKGCPKVLLLKYGHGAEKGTYLCHGMTMEPVFLLRNANGDQFSWVKSLCHEVMSDDAIQFLYGLALGGPHEKIAAPANSHEIANLQLVEGSVFCDLHGSVHDETGNPFDELDAPECRDHWRPLFMAPDRA